jgi:hypothetical protein
LKTLGLWRCPICDHDGFDWENVAIAAALAEEMAEEECERLSTTQRSLHQLGDVKAALQLLARKEKPSEKPSGFQALETENRMAP